MTEKNTNKCSNSYRNLKDAVALLGDGNMDVSNQFSQCFCQKGKDMEFSFDVVPTAVGVKTLLLPSIPDASYD